MKMGGEVRDLLIGRRLKVRGWRGGELMRDSLGEGNAVRVK